MVKQIGGDWFYTLLNSTATYMYDWERQVLVLVVIYPQCQLVTGVHICSSELLIIMMRFIPVRDDDSLINAP